MNFCLSHTYGYSLPGMLGIYKIIINDKAENLEGGHIRVVIVDFGLNKR